MHVSSDCAEESARILVPKLAHPIIKQVSESKQYISTSYSDLLIKKLFNKLFVLFIGLFSRFYSVLFR